MPILNLSLPFSRLDVRKKRLLQRDSIILVDDKRVVEMGLPKGSNPGNKMSKGREVCVMSCHVILFVSFVKHANVENGESRKEQTDK